MKLIACLLLISLLIAAGCTQAPPAGNKTNQTNVTPPGYEAADYCKADSDCVRLARCCDCGLGVYVNKYNQKYPDCTKEPVCECADIESKGKCQDNRCVGIAIEMPPLPQNNNTTKPDVYNPKIVPADFTSRVANKYFTLTSRQKMVYESETADGTERTEVYVTNETRMVAGVQTTVVWDRVWLEGDLIEDTNDYYAQDKDGNVWYFGEDTKELSGGAVTTTAGSWEAGVGGAKPGIIMKANPVVGDSYRQEYYAGEAEDMADVISLNESVSVPFGSFTGCIKTRDWTPLEPGADENKYYCASVGGVVLEVVVEDNETESLVSVENNVEPSPSAPQHPPEVKTNITEQEAKQIALQRVPGKVTDVAIETKFGKLAYVVEVDADNGPETDVIIDIATGEVLAVET